MRQSAFLIALLSVLLLGCGRAEEPICAVDASPDVSFFVEPNPPLRTLPAPYGQKNCPGAAVVEIAADIIDSSREIQVSALWSSSIDTMQVPCGTRSAHLRVFVQDDDGSEGWRLYEEIDFFGRDDDGVCTFSVHGRRLPPPSSVNDAEGYGWVHIPTAGVRRVRFAISAVDGEGTQLDLRVGLTST